MIADLSPAERGYLLRLLEREWSDADARRCRAAYGSGEEAGALAHQQLIESVQAKVREAGR